MRKNKQKKEMKRYIWIFKENDKIFVKNFMTSKGDVLWFGPMAVVEVSEDQQRVRVLKVIGSNGITLKKLSHLEEGKI